MHRHRAQGEKAALLQLAWPPRSPSWPSSFLECEMAKNAFQLVVPRATPDSAKPVSQAKMRALKRIEEQKLQRTQLVVDASERSIPITARRCCT